MNFWILAAAFLTGIFASLGLGGGMILILYMTIFAGYTQLDAQGINLIFFIPIALLSLIIHTKSKLVKWKKIIPSVICGIITAVIGCIIAKNIGNEYLTKIFAVFVLLTGIKELFTKVTDVVAENAGIGIHVRVLGKGVETALCEQLQCQRNVPRFGFRLLQERGMEVL